MGQSNKYTAPNTTMCTTETSAFVLFFCFFHAHKFYEKKILRTHKKREGERRKESIACKFGHVLSSCAEFTLAVTTEFGRYIKVVRSCMLMQVPRPVNPKTRGKEETHAQAIKKQNKKTQKVAVRTVSPVGYSDCFRFLVVLLGTRPRHSYTMPSTSLFKSANRPSHWQSITGPNRSW